ncbi:MAG: hypothetical protein PWQ55_940 [Chloroflexota bacterium]|nr:hypothetical protein [Chloroflexota bacterium]
MSFLGKLFKNTKRSITKSEVRAFLPSDFPERMTDYFLDIYDKGNWTTPADPEKNFDRFLVIAKVSKGDGLPPELEPTLQKEGGRGKIPTFECDLTPYNLDFDQAHIFMKYVGKIVAFSIDFDLQDWRSSILWSDSSSGGTDKIAVGRGYKKIR